MRQHLTSWKHVRPLVQVAWALGAAGYFFTHGLTHTLATPLFLVPGFVLTVEWVRLTYRWVRYGDAALTAADR